MSVRDGRSDTTRKRAGTQRTSHYARDTRTECSQASLHTRTSSVCTQTHKCCCLSPAHMPTYMYSRTRTQTRTHRAAAALVLFNRAASTRTYASTHSLHKSKPVLLFQRTQRRHVRTHRRTTTTGQLVEFSCQRGRCSKQQLHHSYKGKFSHLGTRDKEVETVSMFHISAG